MVFDEHDEWFDGFGAWEEVWPLLQDDDWMVVQDVRQRLTLHSSADGLCVYERPALRLRARHRRGLHRLGFRPTTYGRLTEWLWEVDAVLAATDLDAYETDIDKAGPFLLPTTRATLRHRLIRNQLVTQQAQRVVQEVFRSLPADIAVSVYREPDPWDEDWDEEGQDSWPLPRC